MSKKPKGRGRRPVPITLDGLPPHYVPGFYAGGLARDISEIYPASIFEQLWRDHKIGEPKHPALWDFLRFAASVYFFEVTTEEIRVPAHFARDRFSSIAANARTILKDIEFLDSRFRLAVAREAGQAAIDALSIAIRPQTYFSGAEGIEMTPPVPIREITAAQLTHALEMVAYTAERHVERFKKDDGGRATDRALDIWISNAQSFWTVSLGRRFTYDAQAGKEGHTAAFRFCSDALRPLAPEISASMLSTAMRKIIKGKPRKNAPE